MTLREFFAVVELRTKVVSFSSFILGTLYAVWSAGRFSAGRAAAMLAATLAVDMGTTAWNTYFDYLRGTDDARFNRERDKVLVHGGVAPGSAFFASLGLFAGAVVLGLALSIAAGWWVAAAGAVCMLAGFFYNAGPLPISRTPFGEIFAGGFLGTVLFLIAWGVQISSGGAAAAVPGAAAFRGAVFASLPSFLFIASILTVNNTCDIDGDWASGRRTLSILIGRRAGEALVYCLGFAACGVLGVLAVFGVLPRSAGAAAMVSAVLAAREYRRMHRRGYSHETKGPNMGSIVRVFTVYSLCYAAAVGIVLLREGVLP
jgi:1,4-dihydroxy-2-naphthoate octaprenyltransferase